MVCRWRVAEGRQRTAEPEIAGVRVRTDRCRARQGACGGPHYQIIEGVLPARLRTHPRSASQATADRGGWGGWGGRDGGDRRWGQVGSLRMFDKWSYQTRSVKRNTRPRAPRAAGRLRRDEHPAIGWGCRTLPGPRPIGGLHASPRQPWRAGAAEATRARTRRRTARLTRPPRAGRLATTDSVKSTCLQHLVRQATTVSRPYRR